jgi:hypothetical protein
MTFHALGGIFEGGLDVAADMRPAADLQVKAAEEGAGERLHDAERGEQHRAGAPLILIASPDWDQPCFLAAGECLR